MPNVSIVTVSLSPKTAKRLKGAAAAAGTSASAVVEYALECLAGGLTAKELGKFLKRNGVDRRRRDGRERSSEGARA